MGLDIHIYKRKRVSDNWRDNATKISKGEKPDRNRRVIEETEMLYLRKANQIHRYIVNNFADGKDECQDIYLDIKDIKKLRELCKRILKESKVGMSFTGIYTGKKIINAELAEELLPTQAGFFFGSTAYDEWYLEDLESYVKQADEILKDYKAEIKSGTEEYNIDYVYRASW